LASFYWNKHPSLPAAGHEPALEPGRHHLSRVKFPKTAVAQPPLSVSGLVSRSLRLGLGATQANLVPALCVEFSAVMCSQEMEIVQKEMFCPVVPVVTSEDVPQKSALGIKPSQFG